LRAGPWIVAPFGRPTPHHFRAVVEKVPRNLIRPEEIADAICFLIANSAVSREL
jgi:hypothetical protein